MALTRGELERKEAEISDAISDEDAERDLMKELEDGIELSIDESVAYHKLIMADNLLEKNAKEYFGRELTPEERKIVSEFWGMNVRIRDAHIKDMGLLKEGLMILRKEGWNRHYGAAPRKNLPW